MPQFKSLSVFCGCGHPLLEYWKRGKGRLRKVWFGRIKKDLSGCFKNDPPLPLNSDIHCPECDCRIATIRLIKGKHVAKINQGNVRH